MRDILYEIDERDGQLHHVQRIFDWGEYQLDYEFGTELTTVGTPINGIASIHVYINVK